jgi:dTDP-4-dehydrorhamnose 3,5-epimerase
VIDGLLVLPLSRIDDARGWFYELRRDSLLPKPMTQTNVSFSRKGVIRGLHYHEQGQDDLFCCLAGMARVVVLDRDTDETFSADIGDENPVAVYVPGQHAHGFEDPDERTLAWDDPRVKHLWSTDSPILSARDTSRES